MVYSKARIAIDTLAVEFIATPAVRTMTAAQETVPPSGHAILDQSMLVDVTQVGSNNDFQRMSMCACVLRGMCVFVCLR